MMKLPFAKTARLIKGAYFSLALTGCAQDGLRIWFRPRILRDVTVVDWSTTILGQKSSLPVYIVRVFLPVLGAVC